MSLLELRQRFVEISGRYDLIELNDYSDLGANQFIHDGQKMLDRMLINQNEEISIPVIAGNYLVELGRVARKIDNVFFEYNNATVCLELKTLSDLKKVFGKSFGNVDSGCPIYWSFNIGNPVTARSSIVILAPTDTAITLKIDGLFDTPLMNDLTGDGAVEENLWSLNYPEILIKAALYQLEVINRNTKAAENWLMAIKFELEEIDMDLAMMESSHTIQMEG